MQSEIHREQDDSAQTKDMNIAKNIKIEPKHKYMCFSCVGIQYEEGLKTKDQVHKGKK